MAESRIGRSVVPMPGPPHPGQADPDRRSRRLEKDRNKRHTKADWQFTTADARIKLKRLYPRFRVTRAMPARVCELLGPHDIAVTVARTARKEIDNIYVSRQLADELEDANR